MRGWLQRWRDARVKRAAEAAAAAEAEEAAAAAEEAAAEAAEAAEAAAAAEAPLTDELDLHTFLPRECGDVVDEYLRAAQEAGLPSVRIIHGKGTGALRRTVHAVLDRHPAVRRYQLAGASRGAWGATLVELLPPGPPAGPPAEPPAGDA